MSEHADLAAGRLVDLARDWRRYGELSDRYTRDEMRRAVVVEMEVEVAKLKHACRVPPEPERRSGHQYWGD